MVFKTVNLGDILHFHLKAFKINGFEREYRFHPIRKWRFDFADPEMKIAVECEGGVYSGGRHTRGKGFENDCEKYNAATVMGWRVLRFSRRFIENGQAINDILGIRDYLGG
jgi:very-short-patch-repair endonuclease